MWPWGHLAVGYLLYTAYARQQHGRVPRAESVLVLAFATQFPDLIDKPLAWTVPLLPSGRSLAHSVFVLAIVVAATATIARRIDQSAVIAPFAIGYTSHLAADILYPVLAGEFNEVSFLLWPVLSVTGGSATGILAFFLELQVTTSVVFEITLVAAALATWIRDGTPGWEYMSTVAMNVRQTGD